MKILVVTLALLMAGLAFLVPPLIAVLPVLVVGLLLMASPLIMASLARGADRPPAGTARSDGGNDKPASTA